MEHLIYALLAFIAVLFSARQFAGVRSFYSSFAFRIVVVALALTAIAIYGFTVLLYLFNPDYNDHVDPLVASVSWVAIHGQPLYPDWRSGGDAYGMIYGPLLYYINGLFLLASPTICMSKLPGIVALFGSILPLWRALKKRRVDDYTSFLFAAVYLTALMPHMYYPYSNRADPFLALSVTLALAAYQWPAMQAAIATGFLAGLASGLKLHGVLYITPMVLAVIFRRATWQENLRLAATACAAALAAIILVHHDVAMIKGYRLYLATVSNHPLEAASMKDNAQFALCLATPAILIWLWRKPRLEREDLWLVAGLLAASSVNAVIGSKAGSGHHHLMPFIPIYLYVVAVFLKAPARRNQSLEIHTAVAALLLATFLAYSHDGNKLALASWQDHLQASAEQAKLAELTKMLATYPNAQVGVSDKKHYVDTYYCPLAVFQGASLHFEFAAWMDLAYGGASEKSIAWMVGKDCRVPVWILPAGAPFSVPNWYETTGAPIFSDNFRQTFFKNYALDHHGKFFQAWICKK